MVDQPLRIPQNRQYGTRVGGHSLQQLDRDTEAPTTEHERRRLLPEDLSHLFRGETGKAMRDLYQSSVIISMEGANPLAQHGFPRLLRLNDLLGSNRSLLEGRPGRIILWRRARQLTCRLLASCDDVRVEPCIGSCGSRSRGYDDRRVELRDRRERRLGKERNRRLSFSTQPLFLSHCSQKHLGTLNHILNDLVRNCPVGSWAHLENVVQFAFRELRFWEACQPFLGGYPPRSRREKNSRSAAFM